MKFRGTMAAVLSAALLCSAVFAAGANTNTPAGPQDTPAVSDQQNQLSVLSQKLAVVEVEAGEHPFITAAPVDEEGKADPAQAIRLNLGEDTVCIDSKTGLAANAGSIKAGDEIYAYYSAAMTRSIPPQTHCYALVVNLDEKAAPAHYLTAEEVTKNDDGSVTILAENGTILVTIGKDTPVTPYQTKEVVKNTDIEVGTRFFAWYDAVALSLPGQAHATKAVLLPAAATTDAAPAGRADGTQALPLAPGETAPYRLRVEATVTEAHTSVHEGDVTLVPSVLVKTGGEASLQVNLGENTWFVDSETGAVQRWADVADQEKVMAKGAQFTVFYGPAATASEPAQVSAEAVVINQKGVTLLTAESTTVNPDGSVTLLADNGGIMVTVPADAPVAPYRTKNIVRNTDIRMGTQLFAWYDVVAESYPGQATATKAVLLPAEDRELTMISEGDIAFGQAKVENGVVMVPLRQVAEKLGFTVTWDGAAQAVHLTDGTRQANIVLGVDSYNYSAAQEGLIGMSAPTALGAAAYENGGVTWAPAELFNLLVDGGPVRLHDDVLYI